MDKNYLNKSESISAKACYVTENLINYIPNNIIPIVTESPDLAIIKTINLFYHHTNNTTSSISNKACVDKNVTIEDNVVIEPGAVIKSGASIGAGSVIQSNTVIGENVSIGRDVIVRPNCTITFSLIGNNVTIEPGSSIGQDGFGYSHTSKGFVKFPHIGRVIIQDNVEIGANTTIDRGSLGDTIIGEGTVIDNQVHIAHNVSIGRNCGIAAQVGISGSVRVGDNVIFGGRVGVIPKKIIGDNVQIAAGTGIMRNVSANKKIAGHPHRDIDTYLNEIKALTRIARK